MELTILTWWRCDCEFYTAVVSSVKVTDRASSSTPLIVTPLAPQVGSRNGVGERAASAAVSEGGA